METKGRWTDAEHNRFIEALRRFGKDWYRVEEFIGTRSSAQIRSHAQKFCTKLEKDNCHDYDDILKILDINLRLLKKNERDPTGYGAQKKQAGNSGSGT